MNDSIILIGPPTAGKSTQATLLAGRLGRPTIALDTVRWPIMAEIGYDRQSDNDFRAAGGFLSRYLYWSHFGPYVVERALADYGSGHIIDFGGAHHVGETEEQRRRLAAALTPFAHVFLLLPSPDAARSIAVLQARLAERPVTLNYDLLTRFVNYPPQWELAKHVIYTDGKTPDATCDDIIGLLAA